MRLCSEKEKKSLSDAYQLPATYKSILKFESLDRIHLPSSMTLRRDSGSDHLKCVAGKLQLLSFTYIRWEVSGTVCDR